MANILDLVKEVEIMNAYQDTANKLKQGEFTPEELKASYLLEDKAIKAESKIPKTILEVFGEKSKDADDAIEYGMGLSQEELFDIVMSVTPMGSIMAGARGTGTKGAISFLKGLFGKFKSQNIAKPNRRETEKIINKLMKSVEPDKAFMREVAEHEKNISGLQKSQKNIQKLLKEYDDVYGVLEKPKGMRKVGVRVKD